jgi:hypothetical protein
MAEAFPLNIPLTTEEYRKIERLAASKGLTVDEMATQLVQAGIARRIRRGTGRGPARVYSMRRK